MRTVSLALLLSACVEPAADAPPTAPCDPADPSACLLPWPSSRFTTVDADGRVRLAVDPSSLEIADRVDTLNTHDGFSRVTGVVAGFDEPVDPAAVSWDPADSLRADAPVQVIGLDGARVPYRFEVVSVDGVDGGRSLVIGHPAAVLAPESRYAWVVLDSLGVDATAPRAVRVSLGLEPPRSADERALVAWHAGTRAALDAAGVDPSRVLRVADFPTRSHADATRRLHHMIDALDAAIGDLTLEIDSVSVAPYSEVALIVRGRLRGAPGFLDADSRLALDADGLPTVTGPAAIEFRVAVPEGEGDYRLVLYGHGTGGNVTDNSWDRELCAEGIAKLGLRYDGWTDEDFVHTLLGFSTFLDGSERSTAGLMQSLAGGSTLLTALDGPLGALLSAETIDGVANPAAGRRPRTDHVAWAGGSMGGTMGAVIVSADERLRTAVLNVPGSGWTHMVPHSLLFAAGMEDILLETYGDRLAVHHALVMAQGLWDDVDGAVWADEALDRGGAFLLQQSMGDPVLPNLGTELLAASFGATQLGPTLEDVIDLPHSAGPVRGGATLTQFRVPDTGAYDVHGFAARQTPAGAAALEQILHFLDSAWAGEPEMIFPPSCAANPGGTCDFTSTWPD